LNRSFTLHAGNEPLRRVRELDLELNNLVNNGSAPLHGKMSVLLEWHEEDPVDAREIRRNNIIFEDYQGNRNPFIDHPEFADMIW